MTDPTTKAGKWLVDRSNWDGGMRGFFIRINATGGPEDMRNHVLAIEAEARADALREAAERVRVLRDDTDVPSIGIRGSLVLLDEGPSRVILPDWNAALAAVLTYLEALHDPD